MPWLIVISSYLLGSFPTAYIAGRIMRGEDIRLLGDGNAGARNAFYELGHKAGVLVFFADSLKGAAVILFAQMSQASQPVVLLAGVAAVLGHNFPFYLGFRGGRGESTTIGILTALIPQTMLIISVPVILSLFIWKSVILTSAIMFITLLLVSWWVGVPGLLMAYALFLACLIAVTHFFRVRRPGTTGSSSE